MSHYAFLGHTHIALIHQLAYIEKRRNSLCMDRRQSPSSFVKYQIVHSWIMRELAPLFLLSHRNRIMNGLKKIRMCGMVMLT